MTAITSLVDNRFLFPCGSQGCPDVCFLEWGSCGAGVFLPDVAARAESFPRGGQRRRNGSIRTHGRWTIHISALWGSWLTRLGIVPSSGTRC